MTNLYPGMAFTNIKNNRKTYIPYMLSCILTIAIYYIIGSLANNENIAALWGGNIIQSYMNIGQGIVTIFSAIFLFYINSFLMKCRKSEFGLYNILGMEKRHIAKVIVLETIYVFVAVMALGIFLGILLDKLMYLIILRMFDAAIPLGFYISASAIGQSFELFGLIFLLMLASSIWQISRSKPMELLKSGTAGEREPKARWFIALLGLACLISGYIIAVTTENPVAAVSLFFGAVVLVIIGTYLLFTAGSITLLKLLRKNKGYYYKTKHFISISGMMYRMKRNAVGLANICILSTMVLVMLSATLSMYLGLEDSFNKRYPRELSITMRADDPTAEENIEMMEQAMADEGLAIIDPICYRNLSFSAVYEEENNTFVTDQNVYAGKSPFALYNDLNTLTFVPLEDYNRCMGTEETLSDGQILLFSNRSELQEDSFRVLGQTFTVKKTLSKFMDTDNAAISILSSHSIVVKDMDVIERLYAGQKKDFGSYASYIAMQYMADVADVAGGGKAAIITAFENACSQIYSRDTTAATACRCVEENTYGTDFTGLFFIGIFLSFLFIVATVLIMYYKQITEGYEDKKRFEILQNVGMSHKEVRQSISSQILTVFFLPLVTAGIHIAFAFPFLYRIMMLMNLFNLKLFALCAIGCFLVFALFYTIVYMLTARLYYGIVRK